MSSLTGTCLRSPHTEHGAASSSSVHGSRSQCFSKKSLKSENSLLLSKKRQVNPVVVCGLGDYIGGDLIWPDRGKFYRDVEKYGSIAIYKPLEGGYTGRYAIKLKQQGYHIMTMSAKGLGDLESYLTKVHGVRPPHLGKQPIAVWYYPPEIDYRLSLLPEGTKGLVLWLIECDILSKAELQFLTLLPALRPNVRVVAECGGWRKFVWRPLKDAAGLPSGDAAQAEKDLSKPLVLVPEEGKDLVTAANSPEQDSQEDKTSTELQR